MPLLYRVRIPGIFVVFSVSSRVQSHQCIYRAYQVWSSGHVNIYTISAAVAAAVDSSSAACCTYVQQHRSRYVPHHDLGMTLKSVLNSNNTLGRTRNKVLPHLSSQQQQTICTQSYIQQQQYLITRPACSRTAFSAQSSLNKPSSQSGCETHGQTGKRQHDGSMLTHPTAYRLPLTGLREVFSYFSQILASWFLHLFSNLFFHEKMKNSYFHVLGRFVVIIKAGYEYEYVVRGTSVQSTYIFFPRLPVPETISRAAPGTIWVRMYGEVGCHSWYIPCALCLQFICRRWVYR